MIKKISIVLILLVFLSIPIQAFDEGRTNFQLVYNDSLISHEIYSIFILPGENITLNIYKPSSNNNYILRHNNLKIVIENNYEWVLKAPQQVGNYLVQVINEKTREKIDLNVFVLEPFNNLENGYLNGYKIGDYPHIPPSKRDNYSLPKGFIKVTRQNKDTYLTPHFKLSQFICKQPGNYPKYLVMQELLLDKLEYLLLKVNQKGIKADTFHVMSGYRTPFYNSSLGNVRFSRHIFGDAADIYIDVYPKDGLMDDLNGDGRIDLRDADILYDTVEESYKRGEYKEYIGGLSSYRRTVSHSPFIHIDTRGYKARW
ncbi:MAG TPA: D-Ala-D-Ala carboxypeptidase family metallohydrolase [Halanaerobiales bacterium]|nr:D-Ala-D-Ala carboxypeptidase family metallohydrolase [Halanaerobiales bacterium]